MTCLADVEIQAVADAEASDAARAHVETCDACRARVGERRGEMAALTSLVSAERLTPEFTSRVERSLIGARPARGSTALRTLPASSGWRQTGWWSALAVAAGVALVVFVILPRFGAPASLSASEVLGRSLQTISGVNGVETLEYQFFVSGQMPAPHRVDQLIDHDRPGRYRFSNYGPDGVLESALGQDPATRRRFHMVRVDGRNYLINLTYDGTQGESLPEMGQALVETAITMMQATSDKNLVVRDTPTGRQYVVDTPPVTQRSGAGVFDLDHARAVIDARDFRIVEFEASGALLKQPYSMSYRLIRQSVRPSAAVSPDEFIVAPSQADVVLSGSSTSDPITDVLTTVLRELGRARGHRP